MNRRCKETFLQRKHTRGMWKMLKMLIIREIHIKTMMRYHLTPVRMAFIKQYMLERVYRKGEPSYTIGGNVNWNSHYGEQVWSLLKKLKIELWYDPAVLVLGIHLEKTIVQKDTCTEMFIAAIYNNPHI